MVKSIVAWVGGKIKLMWLINLLSPKKFERSIDVFGGSATVTLNLDTPSGCLKIYNDFNNNLVNLMQCARQRTFSLLKELGFLVLNARNDFDMCKKFVERVEFNEEDLKEELELTEIMLTPLQAAEMKMLIYTKASDLDLRRAAAYYKVLRYSFNANGETYGGKKCDVRRFFVDIWRFSKKFSDVTIENKDFEALIKQYDRPNAFIYCDPPYLDAEGFYKNDVPFTKENHIRLRDTLKKAQGYVMVSYNNVKEIKELYKDFYIYYTTRPHSMSKKKGEIYEEIIITNYDPTKHIKESSYQMHLFGKSLRLDSQGEYSLIHKPQTPLKS